MLWQLMTQLMWQSHSQKVINSFFSCQLGKKKKSASIWTEAVETSQSKDLLWEPMQYLNFSHWVVDTQGWAMGDVPLPDIHPTEFHHSNRD